MAEQTTKRAVGCLGKGTSGRVGAAAIGWVAGSMLSEVMERVSEGGIGEAKRWLDEDGLGEATGQMAEWSLGEAVGLTCERLAMLASGRPVERTEEYLARIEGMRVIDDILARQVFRDEPELVAHVLGAVLSGAVEVGECETQRDLKLLGGQRSLELDVWAKSTDGKVFDLEVQTGSDPDPKRARYHEAAIDVSLLDAGRDFSRLPERWVVFVMEGDPFGRGEATNEVDRAWPEEGQQKGRGRRRGRWAGRCGAHLVYANCATEAEGPAGDLLRDLVQSDPALIKDPELRKRVEYFKKNQKGVGHMCKIMDELREEGREQGLKEGRSEGLLAAITALMGTTQVNAQRAMEMLAVPEGDRARYLAML